MLALKSRMQISSKPFGGLDKFESGDIVYWTKLGSRRTGLVAKTFKSLVGGREVSYASVFCFENQKNYDILCLNLKLLSSSDVNSVEN